jgi:hypothetical protein
MAADAVEAEKNKEGGSRWPTIAAAFDYITVAWPAAKDWIIATGGMSGGGKNSAFLAADLAREHHRIIGMLMMGCNQDMASVAFHKSAPPPFLGVPIFLSSGTSDTIATPGQHEAVKNSLKSTGFQRCVWKVTPAATTSINLTSTRHYAGSPLSRPKVLRRGQNRISTNFSKRNRNDG